MRMSRVPLLFDSSTLCPRWCACVFSAILPSKPLCNALKYATKCVYINLVNKIYEIFLYFRLFGCCCCYILSSPYLALFRRCICPISHFTIIFMHSCFAFSQKKEEKRNCFFQHLLMHTSWVHKYTVASTYMDEEIVQCASRKFQTKTCFYNAYNSNGYHN